MGGFLWPRQGSSGVGGELIHLVAAAATAAGEATSRCLWSKKPPEHHQGLSPQQHYWEGHYTISRFLLSLEAAAVPAAAPPPSPASHSTVERTTSNGQKPSSSWLKLFSGEHHTAGRTERERRAHLVDIPGVINRVSNPKKPKGQKYFDPGRKHCAGKC